MQIKIWFYSFPSTLFFAHFDVNFIKIVPVLGQKYFLSANKRKIFQIVSDFSAIRDSTSLFVLMKDPSMLLVLATFIIFLICLMHPNCHYLSSP